MDRPFVGIAIDGPREQEIKPGTIITLTCRAVISTADENEQTKISSSRKDGTKRVIWSVNDTPMTLQVIITKSEFIKSNFNIFHLLDKKRRNKCLHRLEP